MTAPRRRWSFTLRTLFVVVTVLAIPLSWVGYQLNWIRERHRALEGGRVSHMWRKISSEHPDEFGADDPPWQLRLFGERCRGETLIADGLSDDEAKRIQSLFPEYKLHNVFNRPELFGRSVEPTDLETTTAGSSAVQADPAE
jgi:hypothetical protein